MYDLRWCLTMLLVCKITAMRATFFNKIQSTLFFVLSSIYVLFAIQIHRFHQTSLHVFFTLFCIHMHINDTNLVFYYLLFYHLKQFLLLNVLLAKRLLIWSFFNLTLHDFIFYLITFIQYCSNVWGQFIGKKSELHYIKSELSDINS